MKVTLINAEWLPVPPVQGGAVEETVFETALAIRNPELSVIAPWHKAIKNGKTYPEGIFYHVDIRAEQKKLERLLGNQLPQSLKHPKTAKKFYYLNGISDLLEQIDPDIIQVHNRPQFIPYLLKQFPQKRIVYYVHQPHHKKYPQHDIMNAVEQVVFVSKTLARQYTELYPACANKSHVIYNSVDTDHWHPNKKNNEQTDQIRQQYDLHPNRTILFMGRTVYYKGLSYLIEAVAKVRQTLPDIKLLIAGGPLYNAISDTPFLRDTHRRIAQLQLQDTIKVMGYVSHKKTPYVYAAADVTVVPSLLSEAFGKVVAESMATGVPVIGSKRGGIPELIDDGINGRLIRNPKNIDALAKLIITHLKDTKHRTEMSEAGRHKITTEFSTQIRLDKTQAFYNHLKNTRTTTPPTHITHTQKLPFPSPLLANHGLEHPNRLRTIKKGRVWIAEIANDRYIVRRKKISPHQMTTSCQVLTYLHQHGFPCPNVVKRHDGNPVSIHKKHVFQILTHIKGKADWDGGTPEMVAQVGNALGQFHQMQKNILPPPKQAEDFRDIIYKGIQLRISEWQTWNLNYPDLQGVSGDAITCVDQCWQRLSKLPTGFIHTDVTRGNVHFEKGRLTGLIDFDLIPGILLTDLGIAWMSWAFRFDANTQTDRLDKTYAKALLQSYAKARPLEACEIDALKDVLVFSSFWWWARKRRHIPGTSKIRWIARSEVNRICQSLDKGWLTSLVH